MYGVLIQGYARPSEALLEKFRSALTSTVSDALGRQGAMGPEIRPLFPNLELLGVALTVQCFPGDNLTVHKALQTVRPHDVLVIDAGGAPNVAIMGHNMSLRAKGAAAAGVVTNGSMRDTRLLRQEAFPVYCSGTCPRSPQKNTPGAINVPVQVGGIVVHPGDIVIGDEDGVTVVPLASAEMIANAVAERAQMEAQQADDIRSGKEPLEILFGNGWVDERLPASFTTVNL